MRCKMTPQQLEQAKAERERLRQEVDGLQNRLSNARERLAGVESILAIISGNSDLLGTQTGLIARRGRGAVKATVLELVNEHSSTGLSVADVLDKAKAKGIDLDRGSVSSLLSKLKSEGTLVLRDGNRYAAPQTHRLQTVPIAKAAA